MYLSVLSDKCTQKLPIDRMPLGAEALTEGRRWYWSMKWINKGFDHDNLHVSKPSLLGFQIILFYTTLNGKSGQSFPGGSIHV